MQSFRQYKEFRRALETQISRDREKSRAPTQANAQNLPLPGQAREQDQDLEKADKYGSSSAASQNTAVTDALPSHEGAHPQPTEEVEEAHTGPDLDDEGEESDEHWDVPDSLENRPSNLSRTPTQRSGRSANLTTMGTQLGTIMTGVRIRKRKTHEGGDGDVFIVGYEGEDDPQNPHNWSIWTRIFITVMVASIGFVVGVASSIDSSATSEAAIEFGVSDVVEVMATGERHCAFRAYSREKTD